MSADLYELIEQNDQADAERTAAALRKVGKEILRDLWKVAS